MFGVVFITLPCQSNEIETGLHGISQSDYYDLMAMIYDRPDSFSRGYIQDHHNLRLSCSRS